MVLCPMDLVRPFSSIRDSANFYFQNNPSMSYKCKTYDYNFMSYLKQKNKIYNTYNFGIFLMGYQRRVLRRLHGTLFCPRIWICHGVPPTILLTELLKISKDWRRFYRTPSVDRKFKVLIIQV